jgi:hypothetical protein
MSIPKPFSGVYFELGSTCVYPLLICEPKLNFMISEEEEYINRTAVLCGAAHDANAIRNKKIKFCFIKI